MKQLAVDELLAFLEAHPSAVLLDVREPWEIAVAALRVDGATSVDIPMNEVPARLAEVPEGREVIAVCQKGMRSFNVAGWLRQVGRNATSLQGGMDQWKALGLPVTAKEPQKPRKAPRK